MPTSPLTRTAVYLILSLATAACSPDDDLSDLLPRTVRAGDETLIGQWAVVRVYGGFRPPGNDVFAADTSPVRLTVLPDSSFALTSRETAVTAEWELSGRIGARVVRDEGDAVIYEFELVGPEETTTRLLGSRVRVTPNTLDFFEPPAYDGAGYQFERL